MINKKRTEKNRGVYILVSILMLLAILYFVLHIWDTWGKYSQTKKRLQEAEKSFADLEIQHQKLQDLKVMETSSTGYEMQVRTKFDVIREGEQVVVITDDIPKLQEEPPTTVQKFLNIFKNLFN